MAFSFLPMQKNIMEYPIESETELAKAMNQIISIVVEEEVELLSLQLANGLLHMKAFFQQIQIGDELAKYLDTHPLVEELGFSPGPEQCACEVSTVLFDFYFDFLGVWQYYTLRQIQSPKKKKSWKR